MPAGVYLHIPFCKSRCSYCDFATDVYRSSDAVERYVAALCAEIRSAVPSASAERRSEPPASAGGRSFEAIPAPANRPAANAAGSDIDTIYFGGGTPSLLTPTQVEAIIAAVRSTFEVTSDAEITMEMNPATVMPETLAGYRRLGINRASFGVQTFDDTELKRLARGHTAQDARDTFRMLRDAGFENVSFDLIAGLPRQTLVDWERNVDEALAMRPEHLSLYLLEIHEGTPLAAQLRSERQPMPDAETAAEMYESLLARLEEAGYEQYEISNFARPGFESWHNTKYWTLDPVYAFGVSAHSFDGRERYANERDTSAYVRLIETGGSAEVFREATDVAAETAFLNLRLNRGIDLAEYQAKFGFDLLDEFASDIYRVRGDGLVAIDGGRLFLTRKGMLYSNEVFSIFV